MITLATLEHATAQEVFDQIAAHMLKQKARSMVEDDVCAYRGEGGLKCAAGCLISDEEATRFKPGFNLNTLPWSCLVSRGMATDKHKRLISEMQAIHDNPHFDPKHDWLVEIKKLAKKKELNYKSVNKKHGK
jgi:hypothetical protein